MKGLRFQFVLAVVALSIVATTPATAQTTSSPPPEDTAQVRGRLLTRGFTAFIGWIPGAFVGGWVASTLPRSPCSCDDPGLKEAIAGAVVGGAFGAGLGAATPRLRSRCSFTHRFGLGLLGSAIGTGVGMISLTDGSRAVTVPVFSIIGAAIAEAPC